MKVIHGESSFHLSGREVDLYLTKRGGHLAPVVFHLPAGDVTPYSLSPWEPAEYPELPALLAVLRGDFLCLPFGGQAAGPPHGETANGEWQQEAADENSLQLSMKAAGHGAQVVKSIHTRPGQHAVYQEHRISELEGDFNYGSHPVLDLSGLPEGAGRVTTSPFHFGSVFPGPFANPAEGETQALAEGARFSDLAAVPMADGTTTDLTRYPTRAGNEDLVMVSHLAASPAQPFAWSAVVFENYVWFSLKNPADFPSTLFWISNVGRTAAPWCGRHVGRIGIEDVCSHFCNGVDLSRQDLLAAHGIPTTRHFRKDDVVSLRLIHAVAPVPAGFGAVRKLVPDGDNAVRITGDSGEVRVAIDWKFII